MPTTPSISRWDAIVGVDILVFLDPGYCPVGSGWTRSGLYVSRKGGGLVHLSGSERLVRHIEDRSSIIVVEADERPYRITRIPLRRIGVRR